MQPPSDAPHGADAPRPGPARGPAGVPGPAAAPHARRPPARRQWTPLGRALTVAGDNWTLLIATQLEDRRMRLSELRARLAGVSAGVLDRYLQQMIQAGLLTRTRFKEMPPRVEVELTEAGRELLPIAGALARWGLRRAWSEPQQGEQVDIDALLRLLPVLADGAELPDADIELILHDDEAESRYRFTVRAGRLLPAQSRGAARRREALGGGNGQQARTRQPPSVRIRGDRRAWAAALGPEADAAQLEIGGERRIAQLLLATLHRPDPPAHADGEAA